MLLPFWLRYMQSIGKLCLIVLHPSDAAEEEEVTGQKSGKEPPSPQIFSAAHLPAPSALANPFIRNLTGLEPGRPLYPSSMDVYTYSGSVGTYIYGCKNDC